MKEESFALLPEPIRKEIDHWIGKYPADQKQSAVLSALKMVQESNHGHLTRELMDAVAEYLGMSNIAVYEVATFYTMLNVDPVGRHCVSVCNSISCMLRGSEPLIEHISKRLGIKVGETTPDGNFTLKEVECLAACNNAPVCTVSHEYHENLTPEKMDILLQGLGAKIYGE